MTTEIKAQPACPECEKLSAVSEKSQELREFLEWMEQSCGIILAEECDEEYLGERLVTSWKYRGVSGKNKLLAEYFGIDLDKVEDERRALLDWIRSQHGD